MLLPQVENTLNQTFDRRLGLKAEPRRGIGRVTSLRIVAAEVKKGRARRLQSFTSMVKIDSEGPV